MQDFGRPEASVFQGFFLAGLAPDLPIDPGEPRQTPGGIPHVIIDRHTFIDLATHLEGASEGVLEVTKRCVSLCEDGGEPQAPPDQDSWVALVESLVSVNSELTAIEQTLRALLEANREEEDFARAALRRTGAVDA